MITWGQAHELVYRRRTSEVGYMKSTTTVFYLFYHLSTFELSYKTKEHKTSCETNFTYPISSMYIKDLIYRRRAKCVCPYFRTLYMHVSTEQEHI